MNGNTIAVYISAIARIAAGKCLHLERLAQLPFVPRVGDCLFAEDWGYTFEEGAQVQGVAVDIDSGEIFVWIEDDHVSWRDIQSGVWKHADDMINDCYRGFTVCD